MIIMYENDMFKVKIMEKIMKIDDDNDDDKYRQTSLKFCWHSNEALAVIVNDAAHWHIV